MGFFITLQTNASLIKGKMADLLAKYPPRGAKITLYGASNDTYEKVCGIKDGFEKTNQGLQTLKKLKIPVQLVGTIIRQNIEDVEKMAFYAYINRFSWMTTGSIKPSIRGAESEAKKVRVEEKLEAQKKREIQWCLEKAPIDLARKPCTYCKDYRLGYWIMWNGDMRFCSFMNEPNIPVKDMTFLHAWERLIDYEEELDWPTECTTCNVQKACFKCAGILSAECGSPHNVSDEFCNKVKKYYDDEKKEWLI